MAKNITTELSATAKVSKKGTFEDLITQYPSATQTIARRLREIIYEVLPNAEETVWVGGWKLAQYKDIGEVCSIGPQQSYCNIYLPHGVDLPDPDHLLEGTGKAMRHVKVRSAENIPEEAIKDLIREGKEILLR
jgi:hypothetical protein